MEWTSGDSTPWPRQWNCRLPAGHVSSAVRHRTVVEVWYVISGSGEMWRSDGAKEEVVRLEKSLSVSIPTATNFQFRAAPGSPLDILVGTFPKWPGPDEAESVNGWVH